MLDSDDDMHGMDDGSSLLNRINEALNQDADFIPFSDSLLKKSKNGNKANDKSSADSGSKIIGGSASEKAEGSASGRKSSKQPLQRKQHSLQESCQPPLLPVHTQR